jgi:hypothetical protein
MTVAGLERRLLPHDPAANTARIEGLLKELPERTPCEGTDALRKNGDPTQVQRPLNTATADADCLLTATAERPRLCAGAKRGGT